MKNVFLYNLLFLFNAICCIACSKEIGEPAVPPPFPSHLSIKGSVTDSAGSPLKDIHINIDGHTFDSAISWQLNGIAIITNNEGAYEGTYSLRGEAKRLTQVTIIATDSTGYETQIQSLPVEMIPRFPDIPEWEGYEGYVDGLVIANFVMHKK